MKDPVRGFEPAVSRDDIGTPVPVQVPGADPVQASHIGHAAHDVTNPFPWRFGCGALEPGHFSGIPVIWKDLFGSAVAVDIDKQNQLVVEAGFDDMLLPKRIRSAGAALPGVFIPGHLLAEPRAGYNVRIAVVIDVEREVAEIVDVARDEGDLAHAVLFPLRRFVPVLSRDDVQSSILVYVGNRCRFVGSAVEQMFAKHGPARRRLLLGNRECETG